LLDVDERALPFTEEQMLERGEWDEVVFGVQSQRLSVRVWQYWIGECAGRSVKRPKQPMSGVGQALRLPHVFSHYNFSWMVMPEGRSLLSTVTS
jgi:hypothetical protein